jgi:protein-S-isoprenylcysteine O-methyltransferase Ste14
VSAIDSDIVSDEKGLSMLRYLPPPVIMVITAALMWLTSRTPTLSFTGLPGQTAMAIGVFLIGMLLIIVAALQFYRSGTTISPIKPESSEYLITSGIYRLSRNPIYLGRPADAAGLGHLPGGGR